jgi:hypothetical protein
MPGILKIEGGTGVIFDKLGGIAVICRINIQIMLFLYVKITSLEIIYFIKLEGFYEKLKRHCNNLTSFLFKFQISSQNIHFC